MFLFNKVFCLKIKFLFGMQEVLALFSYSFVKAFLFFSLWIAITISYKLTLAIRLPLV